MMIGTVNIERLFYEDVREKRKTGSGIHSRTGRRGYVGKMYTPNDIMSRKEKRAYRKAGKVVTYNLNEPNKEHIISYEDFKALEVEKQREFLVFYLKELPRTKIAQGMGTKDSTIYYLIDRLGLKEFNKSLSTRKARVKPVNESVAITAAEPLVKPSTAKQSTAKLTKVEVPGFSISYNGQYLGKDISDMLEKLNLLLSEDEKFSIELTITKK